MVHIVLGVIATIVRNLYFQKILDGLKRKGHTHFKATAKKYPYLGVVEAIGADTCIRCRPSDAFNSCIHAVSDFRKSGAPDGY